MTDCPHPTIGRLTRPSGLRSRGSALRDATLALVLLGAAGIAVGQELAPFPPLAAGDSVDEIIVTSRSLARLQTEVFRAEDSFFAAFNALNGDHEFDIHCEVEPVHINSHIKHRVCRANFVATLEAQSTQATLRGDVAPPTFGLMKAKGEVLTEHLRSLVKQNPGLLTALVNVATARESLEAERARRCEGRLFFCRRH
jgi:hypothetical protein